jgi:single-strand DNA-binding protein
MNNVNLIARLTAKPELKTTPNGKSVCNFSVAVERKFKDADGNAIVDYIDCVAWNAQAEFLCKWFDKGVRVGLTGELQTRTYTDSDGKSRKVVEVLVNTVEFADGKREANATTTATETSAVAFPNADTNAFAPMESDGFIPISADDDLPFN